MPSEKKSKRFDEEDDLYELLGVVRESSAAEIRRAFFRMALAYHPDKLQGKMDENATHNFQILTRAKDCLTDPEKRKYYDKTGEVPDDMQNLQGQRDWDAYFKAVFKNISVTDIEEYEKTYKGSEMETEDLKEAYQQNKGDMNNIMESVVLACTDDEERFIKIVNAAIKSGELKSEKLWAKTTTKAAQRKRREAAGQEAAEAAEAVAEQQRLGVKLNDDADLQALIQRRQETRAGGLMSRLEAKYAAAPPATRTSGTKRKSSSSESGSASSSSSSNSAVRRKVEEPSEEEFLAARARLESASDRTSKSTQQPRKKARTSGKS